MKLDSDEEKLNSGIKLTPEYFTQFFADYDEHNKRANKLYIYVDKRLAGTCDCGRDVIERTIKEVDGTSSSTATTKEIYREYVCFE
jgi:glutathionylspermidine synthase